MSDLILTTKPFQLVNFLRPGRRPKTRSVDLSLLKWIRFDTIKNKFVTKYMGEPYTDERNDILYDLIKNNENAPKDWKEYTIKIVGHADTFEKGVERLNVLKIQEFAYTTDSEMGAKEKNVKMEEILKKQINNFYSDINNVSTAPKLSDTAVPLHLPPMKDLEASEDEDSENEFSNEETGFKENNVESEDDLFDKKNSSRKRKMKTFLSSESESDSVTDTDEGTDKVTDKRRKLSKNNALEEDAVAGPSRENTKSNHSISNSTKLSINSSSSSEAFKNNSKLALQNSKKVKAYSGSIKDSRNSKSDNPVSKYRKSIINSASTSGITEDSSKSKNNIPKNVTEHSGAIKDSRLDYLVSDVRIMQSDIRQILQNQKDIKTMLEINQSSNYVGQRSFEEEFDVNLPLGSIEDFKTLDEKLKNNEECSRRFKAIVGLSLTEAGCRKCLNNIFKKFFTRDVMILFTAVKKVSKKELFKDYAFCSALLDVVCAKYRISEEEALSNIGTIFNNSKDWDGHRLQRVNKPSTEK